MLPDVRYDVTGKKLYMNRNLNLESLKSAEPPYDFTKVSLEYKYWCCHLYNLPKGPSINVNIFTSVQTIHLQGKGGGLWKSTFFPYTFNFLTWFLLFSCRFLTLKNVEVYFLWWGGVSKSVWFVHSWKCWHLWMAPNTSRRSTHLQTLRDILLANRVQWYKDPYQRLSCLVASTN